MTSAMRFAKRDGWVDEILVDPLGKRPMLRTAEGWLSEDGTRYAEVDGIADLRLLRSKTGELMRDWHEGQDFYEWWSDGLAATDSRQDYIGERDGVREVYREMPIRGRCVDIGGHQGRLREYVPPDSPYVSVDPSLRILEGLDRQPNLLSAFPSLRDPVNFVCAFAEHLPLAGATFDTAHIRSALDHMMNPELAFREAWRVLRPGGQLIVGSHVPGGESGRLSLKERLKEAIRPFAAAVFKRYWDPHLWHPNYPELVHLLALCGFRIDRTLWLKDLDGRVCFVRAVKPAQSEHR